MAAQRRRAHGSTQHGSDARRAGRGARTPPLDRDAQLPALLTPRRKHVIPARGMAAGVGGEVWRRGEGGGGG